MLDSHQAIVLGASGFIGRQLTPALAATHERVICLSRTVTNFNLPNVVSVAGDIMDPPKSVIEAFDGSVIYHLATSLKPSPVTDRIPVDLQSSLNPTLSLLERTRGRACRWVFASSGGTVYGNPVTHPLDETHRTDPISSYGVIKLTTEKYFELYRHLYDTDYVVARLSNPYGPGQRSDQKQGLIAVLLDRIRKGLPIEVWGDGSAVRDYIFIDDVVKAFIHLGRGPLPARVYNVGSGEGRSVNEIIQIIAQTTRLTPKIDYRPPRGSDVSRSVLSIARITRDIGWKPAVDLFSGIRSTAFETAPRDHAEGSKLATIGLR